MVYLFTALPILSCVAILVVCFVIIKNVRGRGYGKEFEEFVEHEMGADAIKSKELDPDIFFVPDAAKLPVRPDDGGNSGPLRRQREVLMRASKSMVRLDAPMSNTELKYKYGTVNLEVVSEYEENFFAYIYALNSWAESLIEEGRDAEAEAVLYHGVLAKAETSKTYTILADLYLKYNKREEMRALYDIVSNISIPAQSTVWNYINDIYIKMKL